MAYIPYNDLNKLPHLSREDAPAEHGKFHQVKEVDGEYWGLTESEAYDPRLFWVLTDQATFDAHEKERAKRPGPPGLRDF